MKRMKKLLVLLLALSMAAAAGCGSGGSALDRIKKEGKLTMGTNAQFPPFEYISNGAAAGVDVDIATEIAKDLGVELVVQDMEFTAALNGVQGGKIDMAVAGITVTEERKKSMDFSEDYVLSSQYVIIAKGSGVTVDALKEKGVKVGVQSGTTGDLYVSGADIKNDENSEDILRYKNALVASQDLMNGKCSAVIIDKLPAQSIVEANPEKLELLPDLLTEESYAIAIKKGEAELLSAVNTTIRRLKAEGKIDAFLLSHAGA